MDIFTSALVSERRQTYTACNSINRSDSEEALADCSIILIYVYKYGKKQKNKNKI